MVFFVLFFFEFSGHRKTEEQANVHGSDPVGLHPIGYADTKNPFPCFWGVLYTPNLLLKKFWSAKTLYDVLARVISCVEPPGIEVFNFLID